MEVINFSKNNIHEENVRIPFDLSYTIAGNSGSGKSSFCSGLAQESIRRFVTLLPKSEYQFLFPKLRAEHGVLEVEQLPFIHYIGNISLNANPRSTVGTYSGLFRTIRKKFAKESNLTSDCFSFNSPLAWCPKCKGRGTFMGATCKVCAGERYSPEIKAITIEGPEGPISIVDINSMTLAELAGFGDFFSDDATFSAIVKTFVDLNVGYVSLSRALSTLSGGELTRVHLSSIFLETNYSLVVLDELSLGLDRKSVEKVLVKQRELGRKNQLWFIDHSEFVREHAQKSLYFGPGAGADGGEIVKEVPLVEPIYPERLHKKFSRIIFFELYCRNIQIERLALSTGCLTVFTGESGCGKSTLLRDCIYPHLKKGNKSVVIIGQGKSNRTTSRSTLFTYLGLSALFSYPKKNSVLCKKCDGLGLNPDGSECLYCQGKGIERVCKKNDFPFDIYELFDSSIETIVKKMPSSLPKKRLKILTRLGAGHIKLWRSLRTLSTGEFQCVHLALESVSDSPETKIFIFDEPSRGMSQNILNKLGEYFCELTRLGHTLWVIEHTEYFFQIADFMVDFGSRKSCVKELSVKDSDGRAFENNVADNRSIVTDYDKIKSKLPNRSGRSDRYDFTTKLKGEYFSNAKNNFLASFKDLSTVAQWIYADIKGTNRSPLVAIDFERDNLFSKGTFLFDLNVLGNKIASYSDGPISALRSFDFLHKENLCPCCKGKGQIELLSPDMFFANTGKDLFDGLLKSGYYTALKNFNYAKIKLILKDISKKFSIKLVQPWAEMTEREQNILWNGLWNYKVIDSKEKRDYVWQGLAYLIQKYVRYADKNLKELVASEKKMGTCPVCDGNYLSEKHPLKIRGKDLREWVKSSVGEVAITFPEIKLANKIKKILGDDVLLSQDISVLKLDQQVQLKLLDISDKSFAGFEFVFKNILPYVKLDSESIQSIAKNNSVISCDDQENNMTRDDLLARVDNIGKKITGKYGFDLLGYKKIITEINKIKKINPCSECKGKGVILIKSPDAGVDEVKVNCEKCSGEGIDRAAYGELVQGEPVSVWLEGDSTQLVSPAMLNQALASRSIPLLSKVKDWPKKNLYDLRDHYKG